MITDRTGLLSVLLPVVITVFDAILTGRQSFQRLQFLYGNEARLAAAVHERSAEIESIWESDGNKLFA